MRVTDSARFDGVASLSGTTSKTDAFAVLAPCPYSKHFPSSCCPQDPQELIVDEQWLDSEFYSRLCGLTQGGGRRPVRVLGISPFDGAGAFWIVSEPFAGKVFEGVGMYSYEVDPDCLNGWLINFPS